DIPNEPESQDRFRNPIEDWLYVKKPKRPTAPTIPSNLTEWLMVNNFNAAITVKESILIETFIDDQLSLREVFLDEVPEIQDEINEFIEAEWNPFAAEYQRVKK